MSPVPSAPTHLVSATAHDAEPAGLTATVALHARLRDEFEREAAAHERRGLRLSWLRLGTFLAAVVVLGGAWRAGSLPLAGVGALALVGFFAAVFAHGRTLAAQTRALCRRDVHVRHLARAGHGWAQFAYTGEALAPRDHAYAWDIDLVGQGSLFQRIDVTHTREGERTLVAWLASGADLATARARQAAVLELRDMRDLRRELEAAVAETRTDKLDSARVQALGTAPLLYAGRPWLRPSALIAPLLTLGVWALGAAGLLPKNLWVLAAVLQALLLLRIGPALRDLLETVLAKAPALNAYKDMLVLLEQAQFRSPLLVALQARVRVAGTAPSAQLARLSFWVGLAELRENFLHVIINTLTLWDLHVAYGIEGFVRDVGTRMNDWFSALAELEALSSLATLAELDPAARMPELVDARAPFQAAGIVHPLLPAATRVANNLELHGPGTALVVTGSNMAGKSTLLRAVGQNIALALAGGPVCAERMQVPEVRLRASMRANDSLEAGSSYFHAELVKLQRVVEDAEAEPPVFFLLDELLRGTNARARHIGAKAVLLHLLERSGTGLCATHDVELAALEQGDPEHIRNVHFTDVMVDGEMIFDYQLRPGIVRTSNALRLLALAGIAVPAAERDALEGGPAYLAGREATE